MIINDLQGSFTLHNGVEMPYFGLGVYLTKEGEEINNTIATALDLGYRHIDTASFYNNEEGVGHAIKNHQLDRKDIFITTKLWNADQGYDSTLKAFDISRKKLQTDYIDLYLLHWPVADKFQESWHALETLYNEGKIRAIGVSNFMIIHLNKLFETAKIKPMVNQVEYHPMLQQEELFAFCKEHAIQQEAWGPLMQGKFNMLTALEPIAKKYGKSLPQIILRWNLEKGIVTIPKSTNRLRIQENAAIFDFKLDQGDHQLITSLDQNQRVGPDPYHFDF